MIPVILKALFIILKMTLEPRVEVQSFELELIQVMDMHSQIRESSSISINSNSKDYTSNPDSGAFLKTIALVTGEKVIKSEEKWLSFLGRERYCVMRKKATELAFSGEYLHHTEEGIYHCAACRLALFSSIEKYEAGNGWPSFYRPIVQNHVWIKEDYSLLFKRYEVLCRGCDSHLGHVFRKSEDGSLRYTINSISLEFQAGPSK